MISASVFLNSMQVLPGLRDFFKVIYHVLKVSIGGKDLLLSTHYSPSYSPVGFLAWFITDLGSANTFTF